MIGMVDIKEQLNEEKQLEDLRENIRARRKDSDEITVHLTHDGHEKVVSFVLDQVEAKGCVR